MTPIANQKSSIFRASTWAGIAVVLTVGITSSNSTQHEAPANTPVAKSAAATLVNPAPVPAKPAHHWYQFGKASWYGQDFQGRPTASGETFNMFDFTCAHRSLPLGSIIRVTNLRNRKSVVLRVNDRGPVPEDRIVDLSYAAATLIGVRGTAKVSIELIPAVAHLEIPDPGDK